MSELQFKNVTVTPKANVYFDGKIVSHSFVFEDGSKKTAGLVYPGRYHFDTRAPERMDIIAGRCEVQLDGQERSQHYEAGQGFDVPANSGFSIQVDEGIAEYVCSFG